MDFVITQGYHDFGEFRNWIAGKVGLNKQRYEIEIELALTCLSNYIPFFNPLPPLHAAPRKKENNNNQ